MPFVMDWFRYSGKVNVMTPPGAHAGENIMYSKNRGKRLNHSNNALPHIILEFIQDPKQPKPLKL